jgi:amino acid permease
MVCCRFTYSIALASLTTATATLSTYWDRDVLDLDMGWRVFLFLLVLIIINVFGAKVDINP